MATATNMGRARTGDTRHGADTSGSVSMELLIVEDNGGEYHWMLQDQAGNSLAKSERFRSYQPAEDAARVVLAGAGSARLDLRADAARSADISV